MLTSSADESVVCSGSMGHALRGWTHLCSLPTGTCSRHPCTYACLCSNRGLGAGAASAWCLVLAAHVLTHHCAWHFVTCRGTWVGCSDTRELAASIYGQLTAAMPAEAAEGVVLGLLSLVGKDAQGKDHSVEKRQGSMLALGYTLSYAVDAASNTHSFHAQLVRDVMLMLTLALSDRRAEIVSGRVNMGRFEHTTESSRKFTDTADVLTNLRTRAHTHPHARPHTPRHVHTFSHTLTDTTACDRLCVIGEQRCTCDWLGCRALVPPLTTRATNVKVAWGGEGRGRGGGRREGCGNRRGLNCSAGGQGVGCCCKSEGR